MEARRKTDLIWAPLFESFLILLIGAISWLARQPMLFASLGPTAYEQVETPEVRSAKPYNIVVGHFVGLLTGFAGLFITHAWSDPKALQAGYITAARIFACVIGAALGIAVNLLLRAAQPAALATTLLVTLGSYQTFKGSVIIMSAVVLLAILGEPLRRLRLKQHKGSDLLVPQSG